MSQKLGSGSRAPVITLPRAGGGEVTAGCPATNDRWQLLVVYRGRHCPICKRYLARFEAMQSQFAERRTDIVAISADTKEKAEADLAEFKWSFPVGYGLEPEAMRRLGLYISNPRDAQETDRPFAEPGLFAIRPDGVVQLIGIGNGPTIRPDPELVLRGIATAQDRGGPPRGTAG